MRSVYEAVNSGEYIYIYQRLAQTNVSVGARNLLFQLCPSQAYYTHKRHQTNDLVCVCVVADALYGDGYACQAKRRDALRGAALRQTDETRWVWERGRVGSRCLPRTR